MASTTGQACKNSTCHWPLASLSLALRSAAVGDAADHCPRSRVLPWRGPPPPSPPPKARALPERSLARSRARARARSRASTTACGRVTTGIRRDSCVCGCGVMISDDASALRESRRRGRDAPPRCARRRCVECGARGRVQRRRRRRPGQEAAVADAPRRASSSPHTHTHTYVDTHTHT